MNLSTVAGPAMPTADVQIAVGVVDVVVLAPAPHGRRDRWRVLTLRRAVSVRCTGAWEVVHGRIEPGELPAAAARREVFEETGMVVQRLYAIAVNPFFLPRPNTIQMAVVFAAVVEHASVVMLSDEHDASLWRTPAAAIKHLAWPREHDAVRYAVHLLRDGDAGAVEDVLRVPDA
ncbi:NUDIX domain-containing protein [Gemmatimonas sp.]|uniref:NUDIX domain-containing protein n=1 Tax=Gemmatimonas sp. TaxID=1962908 RepID=UPI003563A576